MVEGSSVASASASSAATDLQRVTVTVAFEQSELLGAALADLAPAGWCEVPGTSGASVELWLPRLDVDGPARLRDQLAARGLGATVASEAQDDSWVDGMRRHHQPIEVGGRLLVRPPWTEPRPGLLDIVIDPGMAFGTGQHATTKGCLTLLLDEPGGSLLDVGCGSGVLSIAAAKLGYCPISAIDFDPLATEATLVNAQVNSVELSVAQADASGAPLATADTLVANITATPVIALAGTLPEPAPRRVILSGFRPADAERVAAAWQVRGYAVGRRVDEDNWTALLLTRG